MKLTEVIRRPLITEKTTVLREDGRTLVFHVLRDANKLDVKRAVETLLGAKVENVRTRHGPRQGEAAGALFGSTVRTGRRPTCASATGRSCRSSCRARKRPED